MTTTTFEDIKAQIKKKGYSDEFIDIVYKNVLKATKDEKQALIELNMMFAKTKSVVEPECISAFLERNIPPVDYLVMPILPKVGVSMVFGHPKSGKTKFMEYVVLKGLGPDFYAGLLWTY